MAYNFCASTTLVFVLALVSLVFADIPGVERQASIDELEHFLVDNGGYNSVPFASAVSPCAKYSGFAAGGSNQGEQTSAQWVRFAFHDFVTADLSAGTGGLDASLGFEGTRDENKGLFVDDTMKFISQTFSALLSTADQVTLAVVLAVAGCGGNARAIPLRVGRTDAVQAGPSGVPGPFTPLQPTLAQFAKAGFSATETIALVSCGHSLGRIHFSNFPDIVDNSAVSATNLNGGIGFDSTPAGLDPAGMLEYLDGTKGKGGPLVTSPNVAARSDLRLFISDGNATIRDLSQNFGRTCSSLFTKMLNTVPSSVSLSAPVTPQTWKVTNILMHISNGGSVRIEGLFRYLWTTVAPPEKVTYTTISPRGTSATHRSNSVIGTGTSLFGNTTYWDFARAIDSPGTTTLSFQGATYPINDMIFILPTQSRVEPDKLLIRIKAAAATSITAGIGDMEATLYVPVSQAGSKALKITTVKLPLKKFTVAGNYTLYEGKINVANVKNVVAKVVLGSSESQSVKTSLFKQGS
ncbi:heme peroxidase [Leptodontidium sp. MPI-SDFR-AT-0119]|nr:heme peroxidase [Leptodontidium sp. MPI-SDFR-AT-0119]